MEGGRPSSWQHASGTRAGRAGHRRDPLTRLSGDDVEAATGTSMAMSTTTTTARSPPRPRVRRCGTAHIRQHGGHRRGSVRRGAVLSLVPSDVKEVRVSMNQSPPVDPFPDIVGPFTRDELRQRLTMHSDFSSIGEEREIDPGRTFLVNVLDHKTRTIWGVVYVPSKQQGTLIRADWLPARRP